MTAIEAPHRALHDILSDLAQSERDLEDAILAEEEASQRVDDARADSAVGRLLKGVLLRHQRRLSDLQGQRADLEWKIKGLRRLETDVRGAADRERERAAAERGVVLRAAGALLAGQFHAVLSRFLADLEELEQEAARFNGQANMPAFYRLRPPSDYPVLSGRTIDSIQQLLTVYPPSPTITKTNGGGNA